MFLTLGNDDLVRKQNPLVLGTTYTTTENIVPADTLSAPDLSRTLMNLYGIQTEEYFNKTALLDQMFSSSGVYNLVTSGISPMNFTFTNGTSTTNGFDFMERTVGSSLAHYVRLQRGVANMSYANSAGHGRVVVNVPRIKLAERQLVRALSLYTLDGTEYVNITYNWTTATYSLAAAKLNSDGVTLTTVSLTNGGAGYATMVDMLVALYGSALGTYLNIPNNRLDTIVLEPTFYIVAAGTYYIKISSTGTFYCDTAAVLSTEMLLYTLVITSGTPWTCAVTDNRTLYSPGTAYVSSISNLASTSASVYNTNTTTLSIGGAATAINIGNASGTLTIGNPTIVGSTSLTLFNTVSTTVNAFGAATTLNIGAATGTLTIGNPTIIGKASLTLFNTVSTTVNAFGAATTLNIGGVGTTLTINASTINGPATVGLFSSVTTTNGSLFINASSVNIGTTSGTLTLNNPTIVGSTSTLAFFNTIATVVGEYGAVTNYTLGGVPTTAVTFNIANNITASSTTKTINIGVGGASGSITNVNIGSSTSGATGTLTLNNPTIVGSTSLTLFNTVSTTVNAFGAATSISIGNASSSTTFSGSVTVLTINGVTPGTLGKSLLALSGTLGTGWSDALVSATNFDLIIDSNAKLNLLCQAIAGQYKRVYIKAGTWTASALSPTAGVLVNLDLTGTTYVFAEKGSSINYSGAYNGYMYGFFHSGGPADDTSFERFDNVKINITNTSDTGIGFYNCTSLTSCTGTGNGGSGGSGYGFYSCISLSNCTGTGSAGDSSGYGFYNCTNITNCAGTGNGGSGGSGYGFYSCISLSNCTGTGSAGDSSGYGFYSCISLSNCTGTGSAGDSSSGIGFYNCTNITNCAGTGNGGSGGSGYGFYSCISLSNCTGTGSAGDSSGYGFCFCTSLTSCIGTGSASAGYGFYSCTSLTSCTGTGTGSSSDGIGFDLCIGLVSCGGCGLSTSLLGLGYGFKDCKKMQQNKSSNTSKSATYSSSYADSSSNNGCADTAAGGYNSL